MTGEQAEEQSEETSPAAAAAREAATREVLQIISRSRDDEQPAFDAIVRLAKDLCGALFAGLVLGRKGDAFQRVVASENLSPQILQLWTDGKYTMERGGSLVADAILDRRVAAVGDMGATHFHQTGDERYRVVVTEGGVRSNLLVPLVLNGEGIGCLMLGVDEVRPYTADQVQLVETFAMQAVIAIENVRQFREVQERLEREEASAQVLGVISRSRDDEAPVFDVILENAARLCNAPLAFLSLADDERTKVVIPAHRGARPEFGAVLDNFIEPFARSELIAVRPLVDGEVFRQSDISDDELYRNSDPRRVQMVDIEGIRSVLAVPMFRGADPIGAIILYRREVAPFSDDDVTLVETFAAQAVIAIENVRQFREVQERLEREEASAQVLEVISRSRDDEAPVFDAILENAARLCNAPHAFLQLRSDDDSHLAVAAQNFAASAFLDGLRENPIPIHDNPGSISVLGMNADAPAMYDDVGDLKGTKLYTEQLGYAIDREGMRTALFVPLKSEDRRIGVIVLYRLEVAPFSADEIALIETFAAQAVIAIENVRQFKALETLNAELGDRVNEQVGEIERMGRLKRFLPSQVADAVVSKGDDILSSHRALIATLFCDIRGFTAFCERAEPEETIEVLQTYHEEMGRLLDEYGAGVEHRLGDGIMAIFNDPLPCEDPAGDALRLALAMRTRMAELCVKWRRLGHRLGFGVGISFGYATVGMVGSEGRYEYTASGTSVNLASRLCDAAEDGEILLSPRAVAAVEDDFALEPRGEVTLKGIQDPAPVHRVVADRA